MITYIDSIEKSRYSAKQNFVILWNYNYNEKAFIYLQSRAYIIKTKTVLRIPTVVQLCLDRTKKILWSFKTLCITIQYTEQ